MENFILFRNYLSFKKTTIKPKIQKIFIFSLFVQGKFPDQYQARNKSSQIFGTFDFFITILIKYNKTFKAVRLSFFPVMCHRFLYGSVLVVFMSYFNFPFLILPNLRRNGFKILNIIII